MEPAHTGLQSQLLNLEKLPASYQTICTLKHITMREFTLWTWANATERTSSPENLWFNFYQLLEPPTLEVWRGSWQSAMSFLPGCPHSGPLLEAVCAGATVFSLQAGWHYIPSVPGTLDIQRTVATHLCIRAYIGHWC